jgi:hypothetical protein
MKLTTQRLTKVELYLHSALRLHSLVFNSLYVGINLPLPLKLFSLIQGKFSVNNAVTSHEETDGLRCNNHNARSSCNQSYSLDVVRMRQC